MATFGELLAELRKDHHMTQKDLAEVFHVSVGTISNYENGAHLPDVERLVCIADYFGVTTDYLLARTPYNIATDAFQAVTLNGKPAYEVLKLLQALSEEQQKAVDVVLGDMLFKSEVMRRS